MTLDHALVACLAIALNALAAVLVLVRPESSWLWIGPGSMLLFRAKRTFAMLEPSSLLMVVAYVAAILLLYGHTGRT